MKRTTIRFEFLALITLVLVASAGAQSRRSRPAAPAQNTEAEDQKAIADLQNRDILANMALDTDKILALRTHDVVYLPPGSSPLVGQEAVRKYLEEIRQQFANWDMSAYEENWQEVRILGDYAYEWGTINIRARKEGETRESAALRNVIQVLHREPDGAWRIARVIWNIQSVPAAQTSGKDRPKE
jgi:uncharacterized protein (TIGR02246 family)